MATAKKVEFIELLLLEEEAERLLVLLDESDKTWTLPLIDELSRVL